MYEASKSTISRFLYYCNSLSDSHMHAISKKKKSKAWGRLNCHCIQCAFIFTSFNAALCMFFRRQIRSRAQVKTKNGKIPQRRNSRHESSINKVQKPTSRGNSFGCLFFLSCQQLLRQFPSRIMQSEAVWRICNLKPTPETWIVRETQTFILFIFTELALLAVSLGCFLPSQQ